MSRINQGTIKKAYFYAKRNGWKATLYEAADRLRPASPYTYYFPAKEQLLRQMKDAPNAGLISIVVPAYETNSLYLRAMLESVLAQSYLDWELIVADASESSVVEEVMRDYGDERIRYVRLIRNLGIAANTNNAILHVKGRYTALLDHDDLLSPSALYYMARRIVAEKEKAILLYSNEDKCDMSGKQYYEPHFKKNFDEDLFLRNNFICHLAVIRSDVLMELGLRSEYDGAQDYDLFLRIIDWVRQNEEISTHTICHVDEVLYHWRCHPGSTAVNPMSKQYAYEAGRKALEDYYLRRGLDVTVEHSLHLGYYNTFYAEGVLKQRSDVGAVCGYLIQKGRIVSGPMDLQGNVQFFRMPSYQEGYMRVASSRRQVLAADLRCMQVREELREYYEECLARLEGASLEETGKWNQQFCSYVREKGYRILFEPGMNRKLQSTRKKQYKGAENGTGDGSNTKL